VAVSPNGTTAGTVYIATDDGPPGNLSVIPSGSLTSTSFNVGSQPSNVAVSPITGDIYVTENGPNGGTYVYDPSNTLLQTIAVGDGLGGVAAAP
jgi:DNA-binding beta-propeller fold protein YncE